MNKKIKNISSCFASLQTGLLASPNDAIKWQKIDKETRKRSMHQNDGTSGSVPARNLYLFNLKFQTSLVLHENAFNVWKRAQGIGKIPSVCYFKNRNMICDFTLKFIHNYMNNNCIHIYNTQRIYC